MEEQSGKDVRQEMRNQLANDEQTRQSRDQEIEQQIEELLYKEAEKWKHTSQSEVSTADVTWDAAISLDTEQMSDMNVTSDVILADGTLYRKIIQRQTGHIKGVEKNWVVCHLCIKNGTLIIYKDEANLQAGHPQFEEPILGCLVQPYVKAKRKNVFKFSSIIGTILLFQASSESDMDSWISKICEVRDLEGKHLKTVSPEHSLSPEPNNAENEPDNFTDNTISDKISEVCQVFSEVFNFIFLILIRIISLSIFRRGHWIQLIKWRQKSRLM